MSSLRLAILQSIEESSTALSAQKSSVDCNNVSKNKDNPKPKRRARPKKDVPIVELPQIDKYIRNDDPTLIDTHGFVEVSNVLSKNLIELIRLEASSKIDTWQGGQELMGGDSSSKSNKRKTSEVVEVEEISNALQMNVSDELLEQMRMAVKKCPMIKKTMETVFGQSCGKLTSNYNGFVLETPKVLVTPPGSNPQLPHADDHCTSCLVVLIHLRDKQEPTRVAQYTGSGKDYPTGITVTCDICGREEMLPDWDFRAGVHLTNEKWQCNCRAPHEPFDFEGRVASSFDVLLGDDAPYLCESYAGATPNAGEGILCLPTLIHRGPGNPTCAKDSRYVLFFTLAPQYKNTTSPDAKYHKYDQNLQIHAPAVLFNQFNKVKRTYANSDLSLQPYFSAFVGLHSATMMKRMAELEDENKELRDQLGIKPKTNGSRKKCKKTVSAVLAAPAATGESWECKKCKTINTTKARCISCKSWKGGQRPSRSVSSSSKASAVVVTSSESAESEGGTHFGKHSYFDRISAKRPVLNAKMVSPSSAVGTKEKQAEIEKIENGGENAGVECVNEHSDESAPLDNKEAMPSSQLTEKAPPQGVDEMSKVGEREVEITANV